ncbi:MAG: hypothetical protein FWC70_00230 [Defluviitaleaceae bacterium]|nr:hypothetical protein [Defluviitaleaceae bacterium]
MKRVIKAATFACMMVFALAIFAGCGGTGHGEGDSHTAALVGEWDLQGSLYYTFNADGTGRMLGAGNIRWATSGGTLSICVTPGFCGSVNNCSGPTTWDYTLSGNNLTMAGHGRGPVMGATYQLTRR